LPTPDLAEAAMVVLFSAVYSDWRRTVIQA